MANMNFGVNILPKTNNTYSLGNSDYKWNIYVNTINGTEVDELTLPPVTSEDNNKILKVSEGEWTVGTAPSSLDLGETSTTAYRGDRGAAAYAAAVTNVDSTPASGSTHLLTSGGAYTALDDKAPKANPVFTGSISMGRASNTTIGSESVAEGSSTTASGAQSHAEGAGTTASGPMSHAEGAATVASGSWSHAEGAQTTASNSYSHAEGSGNRSSAKTVNNVTYNGTGAHGTSSHSEGDVTWAIGVNSHAEGGGTTASGYCSHAEGGGTTASGYQSHAEGGMVTASGGNAHAEGISTTASGSNAHAEGASTTASGGNSHAEGAATVAVGSQSHAEGAQSIASGEQSHAEGTCTLAAGSSSHVSGTYNIADSYANWPEWVSGTSYEVGDKVKITTTSNNTTIIVGYICKTANTDTTFTTSNWQNQYDKMNYAEIVGNGTTTERSNARALDWDGNEYLSGNLYIGCDNDSTGGNRVISSADVMTGASSSYDGSAGLVPAPEAGDEDKVLKGDGTWDIPTVPEMVGADSVTDGESGIVPAPMAGEEGYFLRGDSTWAEIPEMTGADNVNDGTSGLVPAPEVGDEGKFLKGDGTWSDEIPVMIGTDGTNDGTSGVVPAPIVGEENYFLRGDGTWAEPDPPVIPEMTGATNSSDGEGGLVPTPYSGDETKFLMGDGTWSDLPEMSGADSSYDGTGGMVPAPLIGEENMFLRGDGTWATLYEMTGATSSTDGESGAVPAPTAGEEDYFLKGDGTWSVPTISEMVGATTNDDGESGIVPAPHAGYEDAFLKADGTWSYPYSTTGIGSIATGVNTEASGIVSYAGGYLSIAGGQCSHAEGVGIVAPFANQFIIGQYNYYGNIPNWVAGTSYTEGDEVLYNNTYYVCQEGNSDSEWDAEKWEHGSLGNIFTIGYGQSDALRANLLNVNTAGSLYLRGNVYVGCNDNSTGGSILATQSYVSTALSNISTMTGATSSANGTSGLVPAPTTTDVDKFLAGDGTYKSGGLPMVILSYGSSTWAEFEAAYNNNVIVYARASSNSNPASGSQTRMAFMAYVNNATTPTEVEFQYYRSMSSHSSTAMGDQVFVYKLTKTGGWSVTTRDASIKQIKADTGTALGVSWSSNVVTLTNTMTAADMPMSSSDATTVSSAISNNSQAITNLGDKLISHEITLASISNDLNNATEPGIVMFNGSQAASVSNAPVAQGGYVIVFKQKDNEIIQEYVNRRTEGIRSVYIRIKAGSTWSDWQQLVGTISQNLSTFVIPLVVSRSANVVTVTINYTQAKETLSKNTEKILGALPEAYRPSSAVYTSCLLTDNVGNLVAYLRISINSSNGNIYAYPSAAISTSQFLFGSFTYCI